MPGSGAPPQRPASLLKGCANLLGLQLQDLAVREIDFVLVVHLRGGVRGGEGLGVREWGGCRGSRWGDRGRPASLLCTSGAGRGGDGLPGPSPPAGSRARLPGGQGDAVPARSVTIPAGRVPAGGNADARLGE